MSDSDPYAPRARGPDDYHEWLNRTVLDLCGRLRELRAALEVCDDTDARTDIRRELEDTERAVKALSRLRRWT